MKRNQPTRRLSITDLEERTVPNASPGTVIPPHTVVNAWGVIKIVGGKEDDIATVTVANGQVRVLLKHIWQTPTDDVDLVTDQDKTFPLAQITKMEFYGAEGNDNFTNSTAIPCKAVGYKGSDTLTGGY